MNPSTTGNCTPGQTTLTSSSSDHTDENERLRAKNAVWTRELSQAIREPDELIRRLGLGEQLIEPARRLSKKFPLLVTQSFLERMQPGNLSDPLLMQVLPLAAEESIVDGFVVDAVDDEAARKAPGLLQKYSGRALLITTGACAIHCRYCFRREYPYANEPRRMDEWEPAFAELENDSSIHEVILSGGDPLMLSDSRLMAMIRRLDTIPHLQRLRIHSRMPIVLPSRMHSELVRFLASLRMTTIVVVHANHAQETVGECAERLRDTVRGGVPVLNQAVLLRGINDCVESQVELNERLVDLGVMPYYLHLLDRVTGTAHFEVSEDLAVELVEEMRVHLPGYAVPKLVREIAGEYSKTPVE